MTLRLAILVLALGLAALDDAHAAVNPAPGAGDPHIQTVAFDERQVVILRVALGYELTLEFSADERIENVALGNSGVWQVTPNKSADHLFIKPIQGATPTNMTVITGSRTYSFELTPLTSPDPSMAYVVRFIYPPGPGTPEHLPPAPPATYRFSGTRALRPIEMGDDGQFTTIGWAPGAPIPAVYAIGADDKEALVNGQMRDGRLVVNQIAKAFVFRLGRDQARATRRPIKVKP